MSVAKAFISIWVVCFGCPQQITTDQGRQFEACLFKILATITGSSLTQNTAWHPGSNVIIERLHSQLKAALMCHADERWAKALPLVLHSAWKDLKASSAELVYGSPMVAEGILCPFLPNVLTLPTLRPSCGSTSGNLGPYQHPGMPHHPCSFSKKWPPLHKSFYG